MKVGNEVKTTGTLSRLANLVKWQSENYNNLFKVYSYEKSSMQMAYKR